MNPPHVEGHMPMFNPADFNQSGSAFNFSQPESNGMSNHSESAQTVSGTCDGTPGVVRANACDNPYHQPFTSDHNQPGTEFQSQHFHQPYGYGGHYGDQPDSYGQYNVPYSEQYNQHGAYDPQVWNTEFQQDKTAFMPGHVQTPDPQFASPGMHSEFCETSKESSSGKSDVIEQNQMQCPQVNAESCSPYPEEITRSDRGIMSESFHTSVSSSGHINTPRQEEVDLYHKDESREKERLEQDPVISNVPNSFDDSFNSAGVGEPAVPVTVTSPESSTNQNVLFNTNSFDSLPIKTSPFDDVTNLQPPLLTKPATHSRQSSAGGNVHFTVGSEPGSQSQSASGSPYTLPGVQTSSAEHDSGGQSSSGGDRRVVPGEFGNSPASSDVSKNVENSPLKHLDNSHSPDSMGGHSEVGQKEIFVSLSPSNGRNINNSSLNESFSSSDQKNVSESEQNNILVPAGTATNSFNPLNQDTNINKTTSGQRHVELLGSAKQDVPTTPAVSDVDSIYIYNIQQNMHPVPVTTMQLATVASQSHPYTTESDVAHGALAHQSSPPGLVIKESSQPTAVTGAGMQPAFTAGPIHSVTQDITSRQHSIYQSGAGDLATPDDALPSSVATSSHSLEPHPQSPFKPPSQIGHTGSLFSPVSIGSSVQSPRVQSLAGFTSLPGQSPRNPSLIAPVKQFVDSSQYPMHHDANHSIQRLGEPDKTVKIKQERTDNCLSPRTTLWENPEPHVPVVQLMPNQNHDQTQHMSPYFMAVPASNNSQNFNANPKDMNRSSGPVGVTPERYASNPHQSCHEKSQRGYLSMSHDADHNPYQQDYRGPDRCRPSSTQSYHEDAYRPPSRQDYDGHRPSSRQGYNDGRPSSRQGYNDGRPSSRQGYNDGRPSSRQGYNDGRPSSRQGYNDGRPSSRQGYERCDRPSSRQEHERSYQYEQDNDRQSQYRDRENRRPRGSSTRKDPYYGGYHGGEMERPRSQQGMESLDPRYYQGRHKDNDHYYRDPYYSQYYEQYYAQQKRIEQDRYYRGYYEEMKVYGQPEQQQQQQAYDYRDYYKQLADYYGQIAHQSAYEGDDRKSSSSVSRGSTPGPEFPVDNFERQFHQGSRPSSRNSAYEPSPIGPDAYHGYYDQSYGAYYNRQHPKEVARPERLTPVKFSIPHLRVSLGPGGQVICVMPNQPKDGQPATVEIQHVGSLMPQSAETDELRMFAGPLIKGETHKNDVLMFCQQKAQQCREAVDMPDKSSAEIMWQYLELLIKQNGVVIGSDITEQLLDDHKSRNNEQNGSSASVAESAEDFGPRNPAAMERYRSLLLHGHKKEALEWAMKNSIWGHSLFLASKMDAKSLASVMTRFANSAMKMNDPLQTLYQLMSGRQPTAVTLVADDKWGDWKPHLAMMLSNPSSRADIDKKSIITLGDTLASKGCFYASQFCYLMAQVDFGTFDKKNSKLVLLFNSHSKPFEEFATNLSIQSTEIYEYAMSLGNPMYSMINFQKYKYLYAMRLADHGFVEEALHYCEVISNTVLQAPQLYTCGFVKLVQEFGNQLKNYDPQRMQSVEEMEDPYWLQKMTTLIQQFQACTLQTVPQDSVNNQNMGQPYSNPQDTYGEVQQDLTTSYVQPYDQGQYTEEQGATHQFYDYSAPLTTDNYQQYAGTNNYPQADNSYMPESYQQENAGNPEPGSEQTDNAVYQQLDTESQTATGDVLVPPVPTPQSHDYYHTQTKDYYSTMAQPVPTNVEESKIGPKENKIPEKISESNTRTSDSTGHDLKPAFSTGDIPKQDAKSTSSAAGPNKRPNLGNKGWGFGNFISKILPKGKNEIILPDDKSPTIVWDEAKKRWVDVNGDEDEDTKQAVPPPKDSELTDGLPKVPNQPVPPKGISAANRFSLQKTRGARGQYVDVFASSKATNKTVTPDTLFNVLPKSASVPAKLFIPPPMSEEESHKPKTGADGDPQADPVSKPESNQAIPGDLSRSSSQSSLSLEVQQITSQAGSHKPPPAAIPTMPVMFNPSQFSQAPVQQHNVKEGYRLSQRRAYPNMPS